MTKRKRKERKDKKIEIRMTESEINFHVMRQKLYGFKTLSGWIRYCLENYTPKKPK